MKPNQIEVLFNKRDGNKELIKVELPSSNKRKELNLKNFLLRELAIYPDIVDKFAGPPAF